jgi:DNA-binding NarL/FixJ family response regulator
VWKTFEQRVFQGSFAVLRAPQRYGDCRSPTLERRGLLTYNQYANAIWERMTTATCGTILVADDGNDGVPISDLLRLAGYVTRDLGSGDQVLAAAAEERPALVVLSVRLTGLNGYEVCRRLRDAYGETVPIVFVSADRTEPFDRVGGFLIGADDYIVKPFDPAELIARVRRLIDRSAPAAKPAKINGRFESLTEREREVLRLLSEGHRATDIAQELVISPKTVATHIQRVLKKLDVHDRAQAVVLALQRNGDVTAGDDVSAHGSRLSAISA